MRSLLLAQSAGHVHGKEKSGAILLIGDQQEQPFVQANSVPDLSSTNSTQEYALDIDTSLGIWRFGVRILAARTKAPGQRPGDARRLRLLVPRSLEGHTEAEHPGWAAEYQLLRPYPNQRMRVVYPAPAGGSAGS